MKPLNQFSRLPQADQTLILALCDQLTYQQVADKIAQPREEGGLSITTSPSSLCRFYTHHHPQAVALEATGQFASALRINQQAHGEANFEAILGLVQQRILAALRDGKPIADLDRDFRTLQRVQKCFLDDTKYRKGNDRTQEAYLEHVRRIAPSLGPDFLDHTLEADPGAGHDTIEDFEEQTQLELDIDFARGNFRAAQLFRHPTFQRPGARIVAARLAANEKRDYLKINGVNPAFALPEFDPDTVTPAGLLQLQQRLEKSTSYPATPMEIPPQTPSETPDISLISPNFTLHNSMDNPGYMPSPIETPPHPVIPTPDARLV